MATLGDVTTPAFAIILPRAERNAARMIQKAKDAGVQFRPHVKTHRTLEGALLQCGGQPGPIVVSTLAEAEFYADAGFTDMIYGVPIAASKLARVHTLLQRGVGVHVFVDHPAQLDAIEKYANENGHPVFGVYLKVDCGYHRAGVPLTDDSLAFAKRLATSKAVHLHGIYTHSGHAYGCTADKLKAVALSEQEAASKFAAALRANGVSVGVVSVGSTPACATAASFGGVTEIHPGNYILYDCQQVSFGACDLDDCAGVVLSTIISHYPDRSRAIIDAGAFALSKDTCINGEFGHIIGHPDLKIVAISQEEGIVEYAGSGDPQEHLFKALPIGSVVKVVPNHSCLAAANHLECVVIDEEDKIVGRWKRCLGW